MWNFDSQVKHMILTIHIRKQISLKEHMAEIETLLASCDSMRATVIRELDRVTADVNQLRRSTQDRVSEFDPNFRVDSATMRERRHQRTFR